MTRKFLCCFPLRVGNIVFGYTIIIICISVIAYNFYMLLENLVTKEYENDPKFRDWENLEQLFGQKKNALVAVITMLYYASYIVVAFLMLIFTSIFIIGAFKANHCLVTTFFVYSFFHMFLTVCLIVWEATSTGYIQMGLILLSDFLLIVCLFGVRYLMEAIRTGYVYSQPGEVLYKY